MTHKQNAPQGASHSANAFGLRSPEIVSAERSAAQGVGL
jgi:hypothetical protein